MIRSFFCFVCLTLVSLCRAGPIAVWQTAQGTNDRVTRVADLPWIATGSGDATDATLRVHVQSKRQTIFGFGGAFTEAAAYTFAQMSAEQQEQMLKLYFDTDGILGGYSMGRIPMGSCDFTLSTYSLCDTPHDYTMSTFDSSLARDNKWIIPLVKAALARTKLTIFGSPWSPPAWMKKAHPLQKGQGMNGSAYPLGMLDDAKVHAAWALYFSKWIDAYNAAGIDLWGVTVQNEPQAIQDFESCLYTRAAQRAFVVDHLGPVLRQYHPNVKIMAWDHNKHRNNGQQRTYGKTDQKIVEWAQTMFGDDKVRQFVSGLAFHWYQYESEGFNFDLLESSHNVMPNNTFMLNSEACTCGTPNVNNWRGAELYGIDIAGDLAHWAVGWVDWNLLLDHAGGPAHIKGEACEAPLIFNTETKTLHILPKIYYLAHFTRFIRPGAVAVLLDNTDATGDAFKVLTAMAAVTVNGETVVVIVNPGDAARSFTLIDDATSRTATGKVPAHGIQTLVFQ